MILSKIACDVVVILKQKKFSSSWFIFITFLRNYIFFFENEILFYRITWFRPLEIIWVALEFCLRVVEADKYLWGEEGPLLCEES